MTTKKMDSIYLVVKYFLHVKYFYQQGPPCIKQELQAVKFFLQNFSKSVANKVKNKHEW